MKRIFKYVLTPFVSLELPMGAKILTVGSQNNNICLWAEVDAHPDVLTELRYFKIYGTGHPMTSDPLTFIGTAFLDNGLVFHVYEKEDE